LHPAYNAPLPANAPKVVAICIVIVDDLPHEDIWRHWVDDGTVPEDLSWSNRSTAHGDSVARRKYDVRFFIHAKRPERVSEWVRRRLIPQNFLPEWNSPEVVRAMLALLQNALADPACCQRFVFATESCIPICTLNEAGERLFAADVSWLDARQDAETKWERNSFDAVDSTIIPREAVWKALPGWIMLTRKHVMEVSITTLLQDAQI
jgi:hypothetical protein